MGVGGAPVHQQTSEPHTIGNDALDCCAASSVGAPPPRGTEKTAPSFAMKLAVVTMRFAPAMARPDTEPDIASVRVWTLPPSIGTVFTPS